MSRRYRVVHYLNQFFAGFGGEDHASLEPVSIPGPAGPGRLLQDALGEEADIVLTVACGDDRYAGDPDAAAQELMKLIQPGRPDLFIAGPAFNAGRYGEACGHIGREVGRTLGIPAVSGMAEENPGLAYRKDVYIVPTSESARGMNVALGGISRVGLKLVRGGFPRRGEPAEFFPRGLRKNVRTERVGAQRALDVLLAKIQGRPYDTELVLPKFDRVPPAPPVKDLAKARIAVMTTGGLVPKGNPDGLPSTKASTYARYSLGGIERLDAKAYEAHHGGYSTQEVNQDPNRLVPLDILRALEREGRIAGILEEFYTFSGCSTYYESAAEMGREIALDLRNREVDAALITSA